jgi:hypothetical protein
MASDGIFTVEADILKRQRLTGLDATHPVLEQLDIAVDSARGEFFTRLGLPRLNAVIAFDDNEPPTTEEEYLSLIAKTTEQKLIRKGLLNWITFAAKEGEGGRIFQEWNDVGAFRDMSPLRIREESSRLEGEIEEAFTYLSGNRSAGESGRVRAATLGSELDAEFRKVGFSLFGSTPYLFHWALDTEVTNEG